MKNDRLTEDNLKKLDERILKECELRDKKGAIIDDRRSNNSGGAPRASSQRPGATGQQLETRSVASSHISGASRLSRAGRKDATAAKQFDTQSWRSGSQGAKTEVYSEIEEEDEWTAIQKFNTLLHYEEQK